MESWFLSPPRRPHSPQYAGLSETGFMAGKALIFEELLAEDIAAGTLVVKAGEFIGWMRVTLPGGESGWLRTERLVPLYADSAASGPAAG